jgi:hypothetical protein
VLVAPLLAGITTAAAGGTAVGATAAVFSGPLAPFLAPELMVAGAGVALMTDYGLSKAVEYTDRTAFIESAQRVLDAMETQWDERFTREFTKYSDTIFDNLIDTLSRGQSFTDLDRPTGGIVLTEAR